MRPRIVHLIALLILVAGTTFAVAGIQSPNGPIPSMTAAPEIGGRPAELDCTLCHSGDLNPPGGQVEILDVPVNYTPGAVYPLRVRLTSELTASYPNRRWGFQITAVRQSDGDGSGTFTIPGPDSMEIVAGSDDFASRSYVQHRFPGTRVGLGGGAEWSFSWQAPATATDTVHFYCAGNVTDGGFSTNNDFVFTTSAISRPQAPVGVDPRGATAFWLAAPRPNPSRGPVEFSYSLARAGNIRLAIQDLQGREVRRLISGTVSAGPGRVQWDGNGTDGRRVPPGTYFASMRFDGEPPRVRRVILAR